MLVPIAIIIVTSSDIYSIYTPCHELSLPRIEFVLASHGTRNAHVIGGNALP